MRTWWYARLTVLGLLSGLTALGAVLVLGHLPSAGVPWLIATTVGVTVAVAGAAADRRARRFGLDVVPVLALAGTLLLHEYLAGALVASAYAAGQVVEDHAWRGAARSARVVDAPVVRGADRLAAVFVPLSVVAAGVAWWISGDAVRGLAVLVTATPGPLLLAVPLAMRSGASASARSIAAWSAGTGIALSVLAMAAAGVGLLSPAVGAAARVGIEVLVVGNALRPPRVARAEELTGSGGTDGDRP